MKKGERGAGTQAFLTVKEQGRGKQLPKQEIWVAVRARGKRGLRIENGGKQWLVRVGMQKSRCGGKGGHRGICKLE